MKYTLLAFLVLVTASSIFRLTRLDLIEFKTDEAISIYLAGRPLFGHPFSAGGTVSSIGILNPPLFNYLLFPIVIFTRDPQIISFFIGSINVLAIGFFFLVIRRYYGIKIAWLTALFLAFSPWAIQYSRKIWPQNLLIPFFVIFFFAYHKIVAEKKPIYWIALVTCSFFLIQLHQASIFFIALFAVFFVTQKVKINFRYIAIGLFIGLLPLVHYFTYEIKNGCPDCQMLLTTGNRLPVEHSVELFKRPFQITGQGNFNFIFGTKDFLTFKEQFPIIYQMRNILYITYFLLPFGFFITIKRYKILQPLVFATVLLPATYYMFRLEPFMHYFIIVIPLLFFLIASFFVYLLESNKIIKTASIILVISFIGTSVAINYSFFKFLAKQDYLGGDFGSTYRKQKSEIKEKLELYKQLKNPQETVLASYIPLRFMYGFMPLGRLLYSGKKSEIEIQRIEEIWKAHPEDVQTQQELFAAFTQSPPTQETVEFFFQKKATLPLYEQFYEETDGYFRSKNFLRMFFSKNFDLTFYYPEHWHVEEDESSITIKSDDATTTIERQSTSSFDIEKLSNNERLWDYEEIVEIDANEITVVLCTTSDLKLCGLSFYPLFIRHERFIITHTINTPMVFLSNKRSFQERKATLFRLIRSVQPE